MAVGSVQLTDASQEFFALAIMFDGQLAKSGGVLSSTITLNEQVEVFPSLSIAVYVTCVVPTGKMSPELWELVTVTGPQSEATGATQVTLALQDPPAETFISEQPEN